MNNNKMICPIVFNTRVQAEIVLDKMDEIIERDGMVSVANLYDFVGLTKDDGDSMYGWTNLRKAEVVTVKSGYELHFPTPQFFQVTDVIEADSSNLPTSAEIHAILIEDKESKPDMVNHPQHYKSETGMEVIDVIEAFTFDLTGIEAVDTGNILKYICRWKKKNGLEDLKKAQWYLNHLIAHVENLEKEND